MVSAQVMPEENRFRDMCILIHALNVASCVAGLTILVAAIMAYPLSSELIGWVFLISPLMAVAVAYTQRPRMAGTLWAGHLTSAIHTFWLILATLILCAVLVVTTIGAIAGIVFMGLTLPLLLIRTSMALVKALRHQPIKAHTPS